MIKTNDTKKTFDYYTMNMPQWFFDLSDEEKTEAAQRLIRMSDSDRVLSADELVKELLPET